MADTGHLTVFILSHYAAAREALKFGEALLAKHVTDVIPAIREINVKLKVIIRGQM